MCLGDDPNCHAFEEHRRRFKRDLEPERRAFLKSGFAATGAAAAAFAAGGPSLVSPALAQASGAKFAATGHYHLPANAETVHWGFFSRSLKPQVEIGSGDFVTIETLTHQASDDAERMIQGDPGAESVYLWTNATAWSTSRSRAVSPRATILSPIRRRGRRWWSPPAPPTPSRPPPRRLLA